MITQIKSIIKNKKNFLRLFYEIDRAVFLSLTARAVDITQEVTGSNPSLTFYEHGTSGNILIRYF